jgi:hypothetical protein
MNSRQLFVAVPMTLLVLSGPANAGQSINLTGTITCVNDKWDEKEPEKGHKLADYGGRCVIVPDDAKAPKYVEDCTGSYEFKPDGSWKGAGACTADFKEGNTVSVTWEEGSQLKEYVYTFTGGTGTYKGAKGGGTYKTDELSSTIYAGRKKGSLELP